MGGVRGAIHLLHNTSTSTIAACWALAQAVMSIAPLPADSCGHSVSGDHRTCASSQNASSEHKLNEMEVAAITLPFSVSHGGFGLGLVGHANSAFTLSAKRTRNALMGRKRYTLRTDKTAVEAAFLFSVSFAARPSTSNRHCLSRPRSSARLRPVDRR